MAPLIVMTTDFAPITDLNKSKMATWCCNRAAWLWHIHERNASKKGSNSNIGKPPLEACALTSKPIAGSHKLQADHWLGERRALATCGRDVTASTRACKICRIYAHLLQEVSPQRLAERERPVPSSTIPHRLCSAALGHPSKQTAF